MPQFLPVSAVIPTRNRPQALGRTLESLASQSAQPSEIMVVDASDNRDTAAVVEQQRERMPASCKIVWRRAGSTGAAVQRNEGVAAATQSFILFCDDDVLFEPECVMRLWNTLETDTGLGGVNAMIVNQQYHPPGFVSRIMFTLMNGGSAPTFAGKVIGPAVNLLPEDRSDLPEVVPVDWMNLGCTIYRREALPCPPFRAEFSGYSAMEDLALSLEVARSWKLANARTARIFHDSQPGDYKSDHRIVSCMELTNRHFVMTRGPGKRSLSDYVKLTIWELFSVASVAADRRVRKHLLAIIGGKWRGLRQIMSRRRLA